MACSSSQPTVSSQPYKGQCSPYRQLLWRLELLILSKRFIYMFRIIFGINVCVCVCMCVCAGFVMCVCVGFVMCGCFGNMYTVLWLRSFLTWLRFILPWLRVFRAFFLSCKANSRLKVAKTGHGPHSSTLILICVVRLLFVLFYVLFVCVNVYCHRLTTQLQLTNIIINSQILAM